MISDEFLSFLGITKKSGNLFLGMDVVKENIKKKGIMLVLTAKDISESSFEKISFICKKNKVKILKIDYTMEDIKSIFGKYSGIIGISNENFAKKIVSITAEHKEELYGKKI